MLEPAQYTGPWCDENGVSGDATASPPGEPDRGYPGIHFSSAPPRGGREAPRVCFCSFEYFAGSRFPTRPFLAGYSEGVLSVAWPAVLTMIA